MTGSGKTLAFVIPVIELLLKREEKLKKMQVRTESYISFWYILKGGGGGQGFGAVRAACFCRSGPWWSLPQENWLFRSVRWWTSFYKGSPSLREWTLLQFHWGLLSAMRQPGGDWYNLVTRHNLKQQNGPKGSPVDFMVVLCRCSTLVWVWENKMMYRSVIVFVGRFYWLVAVIQ